MRFPEGSSAVRTRPLIKLRLVKRPGGTYTDVIVEEESDELYVYPRYMVKDFCPGATPYVLILAIVLTQVAVPEPSHARM